MAIVREYKYFDRELSWLNFNYRVLQEALDKTNPVIERIRFLGIFSNNQDEFFRVRVATLRRLVQLNFDNNNLEEGKLFQNNLNKILKEVKKQRDIFEKTYQELIKELKKKNIYKLSEKELSKEQGQIVRQYFKDKVQTHLFPIMLKNFKGANTLADKSIYLAVELLRADKPEKNTYAIMEIPTSSVNRFLILPENDGHKYYIMLDDIIRYCLDDIFLRFKFTAFTAYTFKFTRDAELDIDNDVSKSFLEIMADSLEQRKTASALRFVYDKSMPKDILKVVINKLKITDYDQLVEGGRYHNFKDFMNFPNFGEELLEYPKVNPIPHKDFSEGASVIKAFREKDLMLHYPYQSFQYVVELLREASIDPKVISIKMTLYRVSKPSNVINALINAARNGKKVTVFLELQARFDEEANIYYSEELQKNGVNVLTSIPGLKVHCKLLLIKRQEVDGIRYYANIGTGNFHEKTCTVYSDCSLLTSNTEITNEVDKVFGLFAMSFRPSRFRTLVVSPFSNRSFFIKLIESEIENAKLKREAWCIIKLNSLADEKLINKLYQASNAGVKVYCIIRGICKLVPGIKGMSENIEVISIVDKYLEHSRILVFFNGGDERYLISSADWMVRNLDNRIEVTVPVFDKDIQNELKEMLMIQLKDNTKARIIDKEMKNNYVRKIGNEYRAQIDFYDFIKNKHTK
ncbi:MAG: polyphosphate kinase 1 [Bacteroidetes bacterium GWF2_33_16]|nr:MAG: polyphosphate kinase 1 [Bacteroidetes bacterium GWE2_32_14]OFY08803.1 MAG: polyphosphate kinase 1 [Bacteroidetes bacterium GWF2_33_16]